MKPLTNHHAYTSLVKSTKTLLLLLSGGIVLFILILLMQLLSYMGKESVNNSLLEPPPAIAMLPVHINDSGKNEHVATNVNATAGTLTAGETKNSPFVHAAIKHADLSKLEKTFIDENAAKNTEVVKELADVVELREFHFKHGAFTLDKHAGINRLDTTIKKCIEVPESWSKIIVLGFTDNSGSKLTNIKLGMKRAEMLKTFLVKKGIPAEKIIVASFGAELPIGSNKNEEGKALNRRAEFNLVAADSK